jgi:type IV secretory pathway VirB4 component
MPIQSPSIPTDQLSIGYYYKIHNIKGVIATRVGMLLYTFVVEGKNYAKFMDLVDESKKVRFNALTESVYSSQDWTFHNKF